VEKAVAFRLNNPAVRAETIGLRMVKSGQMERWLVVTTGLDEDHPAMKTLISDANALMAREDGFDGIEIRSQFAAK
jgi:hypothetical protein